MKKLINLKYAITSILNKPIFSILIIIQLTASMYFLYNAMYFTEKTSKNIKKISKLFDTTTLFDLELADELDNLFTVKFKEDNIVNRLKEFDEFIENSKEFSHIKFNNRDILINSNYKINDFFVKDSSTKDIENITYSKGYSLNGDFNFFNKFKFPIIKGRSFESTDFESTDSIPIILGYDFSKIFKLNDSIKYYDELEEKIKEMKIIGFLEKDNYFFEDTFSPEGLYDLNKYILYPIENISKLNVKKDNPNYKYIMRNMYLNSFLDTMLISDKDSTYLKNLLQSKATDLNLYNIKINNGTKLLESYKDMYNTQKKFMLVLFFIIVFFTSINIITSLTNHIMNRRKEYCIHLMCGATTRDIMKRVFFEVLILISLAFSCMIVVNYFLNKNSAGLLYDIKSFIEVFIVSLILVIILASIPLKKIANIKLSDIIKKEG